MKFENSYFKSFSRKFYSNASRIDGDPDLCGMCARHGWAFGAYSSKGELLAAAKGIPPRWADGIHPAELWSLLQSAMTSEPGSAYTVDCLATSPHRKYARAWAPLLQVVGDDRGP